MTDTPYEVGYGRPPINTQFQKGQSGNPSGMPGPKKLLKHKFDAALGEALNSDLSALREARPTTAIESFARHLALSAVDGRSSAERLVLSVLDKEESRRAAPEYGDEGECRRVLGDRYDEFRKRFDAAVAAGSVDALLELAQDFQDDTKFPAAGN